MRKITVLLIVILAIFAVNFAFAAEQPEMSVYVADINQGETAQVVITLPSDAQGEVSVSVNGQTHKANIADGKATVDLKGLNAGEYKVVVTYEGSGNYSKVSKDVNLKVSDVSSQTAANASGEPQSDANTTNAAGENVTANTSNAAGENVTANATNTTNNTNKTPTKNVNNTPVTKQPPKKPPKPPINDLAKNPTGIPILVLVIVLIGVVFGTSNRKK